MSGSAAAGVSPAVAARVAAALVRTTRPPHLEHSTASSHALNRAL